MIVSLSALGRTLRRMPVAPASVAALLSGREECAAFGRVVGEIFPGQESEILSAVRPGVSRENSRVWAFLQRVESDFFPVYEADEYEQVLAGIPFFRNGWSYDRFHDLDMRPGELLLFALCAQPFGTDHDSRLPVLDAAEAHVPSELLQKIPESGLSPSELHDRLDGTPFGAAAEFADWLWSDTGSAFLDFDEEVVVSDADWTRENVLELADQWRLASGILDRIASLSEWMEVNPPTRFADLLDAALGCHVHLDYERERRLYACEITEAGLVQIVHDETDPLTLPSGAAA